MKHLHDYCWITLLAMAVIKSLIPKLDFGKSNIWKEWHLHYRKDFCTLNQTTSLYCGDTKHNELKLNMYVLGNSPF